MAIGGRHIALLPSERYCLYYSRHTYGNVIVPSQTVNQWNC